VITVSDSIADYLADLYKIKRPVVVLNAPSMTATAASGDHVRQRLGLSSETPLAVYVGSVTTNRGIENCVRALAHAPSLHIAAVGPRAAPVALSLMQDAKALGVENRFHLIDPVPHEDVTGFIRSADVSLILIQDTCLSYRFCFPNKLLESLLAGVPVLAAKLVELERIVAKTSAGLVVDQTNPAAIADGALKIARNRGRYAPGAETIEFIRRTYAWEQQRKVLLVLYGELGSKRKSLSAPAG
jgi:glycosyltransferase involved in cell wall biosynthesis